MPLEPTRNIISITSKLDMDLTPLTTLDIPISHVFL